MSEKGLKKLRSSIDSSYANMQKLVLKYLHAVCQSLNFFLSELASQTAANERVEVLGVTLEKVRVAQKCAGTFWAKTVELQQIIDETRTSFGVFFSWLLGEILKLSGEPLTEDALPKTSQQDVRFIAEFLANFDHGDDSEEDQGNKDEAADFANKSHDRLIIDEDDEDEPADEDNSPIPANFQHRHLERVGQYLKDEDLQCQAYRFEKDEKPREKRRNPWLMFLEENPDIIKSAESAIIFPNPKSSLIQEHKSLVRAVEDIFNGLNVDMTEKSQCLGTLTLSNVQQRNGQCRQFSGPENPTGIFASVISSETEFILIEAGKGKKLKAAKIKLDPNVEIVDSHFYTKENFSLLLNVSDESESENPKSKQKLLQFPIDQIQRMNLGQELAVSSINPLKMNPEKLKAQSVSTITDEVTCQK